MSSPEWNDDHFFTKGQKYYFLFCGLLVAFSLIWITYLAWDTREARADWNRTFTTPQEFWTVLEDYK